MDTPGAVLFNGNVTINCVSDGVESTNKATERSIREQPGRRPHLRDGRDVLSSRVHGARSALRLLFNVPNHGKMEWTMKELELIDLGDAMAETRCSAIWGALYDFIYGNSRQAC
jgi:hypothetical protein